MNKEELIKMRDIFQKSTDILNEIISLFEKLDEAKDETEKKKIQDDIEEKISFFAVQMAKLQIL